MLVRSVVLIFFVAACGDNRATRDAGIDARPEPPSCTNALRDGDESDVDCGGGSCAPCLAGQRCAIDRDCHQAGDPCFRDVCNPFGRCERVERARCGDVTVPGGDAVCELRRAGGCPVLDTDGDGLQDTWETPQPYYAADGSVVMNATAGVDLDCDGVIEDAVDLALPDARPDVMNVFVEYDYLEEAGTQRDCVSDNDCATVGATPSTKNEQCFCRLSPDSCPSASVCDPITRRCSNDEMTGHFCTHSHKPREAALQAVQCAFQPPPGVLPFACPANPNAGVHAPIILTIDRAARRIDERRVVSFGTYGHVACPGPCPFGATCPPGAQFCPDPTCPANGTCPNTNAACAPGTTCRPSLNPSCVGTSAYDFFELKDANFDPRRRWVYRYAVFAHHANCGSAAECLSGACLADPNTGATPPFGVSGIAELPGNDFIVSLGRSFFELSTPFDYTIAREGGTFMHELGHSLNLRHGGNVNTPADKPNHISIMNAHFQTRGIPTADAPGAITCAAGPCPVRIDYSNKKLPTLDEANLDEAAGIGAGNDISVFSSPSCLSVLIPGTGFVDWDGDGAVTPAPVTPPPEINFDCVSPVQEPLEGYREWPGDACTTQSDCPPCIAANDTCPSGPVGEPIALLELPLNCPIGTRYNDCRVPCAGTKVCAPMEMAFQCRDAGLGNGATP